MSVSLRTPQFEQAPWLILVRFEQARGHSGVPKVWMVYLEGRPRNPQAKPQAETLVRMAVQLFRASCADVNTGHGRDLLPGEDDEYQLHNADGGVIAKADDIHWRMVGDSHRSELVLTWRSPAQLLADDSACS